MATKSPRAAISRLDAGAKSVGARARDAQVPPCSVEVDTGLLHSMEELLADTDNIMLAAFEVLRIKQSDDTTGTQLLKALGAKTFLAGRHAPAPRVLCLAVRRAKGPDKEFKPYLHIIKPVNGGTYKARHVYPLNQLEEVRVAPGSVEYGSVNLQVLDLVLGRTDTPGPGVGTAAAGGHGAVGSHTPLSATGTTPPDSEPLTFGLSGSDQLFALVAVTQQLLRQCQLPVARVTGLEAEEVAQWWTANSAGLLARLGAFSAEVLTGGRSTDSQASGPPGRVLVSAKEEKDLEDLLDMYAMGLGDVAEFESRLRAEHEALEEANIQSLLSNLPMVDSVVLQLKRTAQMLEDTEETLQVFDVKLRHMRQDIGAIEQCNNTLELTARNNAKLLTTLKTLLSELRIPGDMRERLEDPPFEKEKLGAVLKPAWALEHKLSRLQPGQPTSLDPHLLQMRVVREAREDMEGLAKRFVSRGVAYVTQRINQVVEELAQEVGKTTDRGRTKPLDHSRLQNLRVRLGELVRLVRTLDPVTLDSLRDTYTRTVNMLLRKELRAATGELRKAVALDTQHYPLDLGLTKETHTKSAGGAAGVPGGSEGASLVSDLDTLPTRGGGGGGPGSVVSRQSRSTQGSVRMLVRARPPAALDGTSLALPVNEAWALLFNTWLPCLLDECQQACSFLVLYRDRRSTVGAGAGVGMGGGDTGSKLVESAAGVLDQLMSGLEPECQVLLDVLSKGTQQFLALPMLAKTTWWLQQLLPSPEAVPLVSLLASCHTRLRAQVVTYRTAQLHAVEGYASKASGGVKHLHLLAFTVQFSLFLHYLEQVLAEDPTVQQLMEAQQAQQGSKSYPLPPWYAADTASSSSHPSNLTPVLPTRRTSGAGSLLPSRLSGNRTTDNASGSALSTAERVQRVKAALEWQCRLEVDEVYTSLVSGMFSTLDKMAALDPKHGQRLKLENYTYFTESVRPLSRMVTALEPYLHQAEDRQDEAFTAYVQQQLEYSALWRLLEFGMRVDKLLEVVGPSEVPFQSGCSAAEVRTLISAASKEPGKQLSAVAARIRKHLGTSSLAVRVWDRTCEHLSQRYERLASQLSQCYPRSADVALHPSPDQLSDILSDIAVVA